MCFIENFTSKLAVPEVFLVVAFLVSSLSSRMIIHCCFRDFPWAVVSTAYFCHGTVEVDENGVKVIDVVRNHETAKEMLMLLYCVLKKS